MSKTYEIHRYLDGRIRVISRVELPMSKSSAWKSLSRLTDWATWNNSLVAEVPPEGPLHLDQQLILMVKHRLWFSPIRRFVIRVSVCDLKEEERVTWEGKICGVYCRHGLELSDFEPGTCRLVHWEEAQGPFTPLLLRLGILDSMGQTQLDFNQGFADHLTKISKGIKPAGYSR